VYEDANTGKPRPRLADFGIGMIIDRSVLKAHNITDVGFTLIDSNESSRTGTRMYAPPETLTGKPFTAQGDIFAMGVLLYQMTIGELERPLATGWDRDVHDELLREDIRACVDGNPGKRLHAPEEIANLINQLPARRKQRARDRLIRSGRIGLVLSGLLIVGQIMGWLAPLEQYCYGRRAGLCQYSTPKPTDQIVHLDIDDAALETEGLGHWPWPRATLARLLDEIRLAGPKVVGLDIVSSEPQPVRLLEGSDPPVKIDDDAEYAASLGRLQNAILSTSFKLAPPAPAGVEAFAIDQLSQNLEMTPEQFSAALKSAGKSPDGGERDVDLFIRARREAFHNQIFKQTQNGPVPRADLIARLLPHTDPNLHSPLLRTLDEEATNIEAARRLAIFGVLCPTLPIGPVDGTPDYIALPQFTEKAMSCGFVNFDLFNNATLTRIPLVVQYDHHLYPQLGVIFGLAMMNADLRSARIDNDQITVPRPDGPDVVIPSGFYRSSTLHRDVAFINDIPWFGTSDWQTMYDWPKHKNFVGHVSLAAVWDLCRAADLIASNSKNLDDGILFIFNLFDPKQFDTYSAHQPTPGEREAAAGSALSILNESHAIPDYENAKKATGLKPQEQLDLDKLKAVKSLLETTPEQNRGLQQQLIDQRKALSNQIHGKGVLIGSVYTANGDVIGTPLHERCPGVVAQGVIANAVIIGRWWREAPLWVGLVLIAVFGLLAAFLDARLPAIWATVLILALGLFYLLLNGLVLFGMLMWVVPIAGPMLALLGVWLLCNLARIIRVKPI
jgi:CHASE2 domain-containing sensor protein